MASLIPVIIWDGKDDSLLLKTLKSVNYFSVVYLYTSKDYQSFHKILPANCCADLQVFTTDKKSLTRMKNRAIQDISVDYPGSYLTFLEAGDMIIGDPEIEEELDGDPLYYCGVPAEYGDLWRITEDSLPTSTTGIIINPEWLIEKKIEFSGKTEYSFIRDLYREIPERVYTVDMNIEEGRERDYLSEVTEILSDDTLEDSDKDYYKVRHMLTHIILDGLSAGTAEIGTYLAYAYPEKSI